MLFIVIIILQQFERCRRSTVTNIHLDLHTFFLCTPMDNAGQVSRITVMAHDSSTYDYPKRCIGNKNCVLAM